MTLAFVAEKVDVKHGTTLVCDNLSKFDKVVFCFESYLFVYVNEEKGMGYYYKKK